METDLKIEIQRNFVRIDEGQVHYRAVGSLESKSRALVMIHASPASAYSLQPLIRALALRGRIPIYAPDTLGNGDSCKPDTNAPDISYYADALVRQLDALGINEVDIYGTHTGGSIAMELTIQHPTRVRRLIIDGIGLYSEEEKIDMLENYAPEVKPDLMGSQFNWAWHFVRDQNFFFPWYKRVPEHQRNIGMSDPGRTHDTVVEVLKSITTYHHAYRAAFRYPKKERLRLIKNPILMIYEAHDPLYKYREIALNAAVKVTEGRLEHGSTLEDKAKLLDEWLGTTV